MMYLMRLLLMRIRWTPNSGHIDIPENNASEVTDADAGNDVNVENKAEDKKKSKKRKKTKKNE